MRKIPALLSLALLGGCVTQQAEVKIETALLDYGVAPRQAACMADDLSHNLTIAQLRTLSRVAHEAKHDRYRDASLRDLAKLANRVGDPDLVLKVTRATLGCALRG